jgi:fumarate reductase iron-sulfur subunit
MHSELSVSLWRGGADGRYETYNVPQRESQTVLDVVTFVQRHIDPTLSYRFACRVGVCGSCAMTVNGKPRWTCRTHVTKVSHGGRLEIGPLENLPVIKDLATDMRPFFEKWQGAKGAFAPTKTRHDAIAQKARYARAHGRGRRDRMHQLRHLLFSLRYRALERRLSWAGRAHARLDAGQ